MTSSEASGKRLITSSGRDVYCEKDEIDLLSIPLKTLCRAAIRYKQCLL